MGGQSHGTVFVVAIGSHQVHQVTCEEANTSSGCDDGVVVDWFMSPMGGVTNADAAIPVCFLDIPNDGVAGHILTDAEASALGCAGRLLEELMIRECLLC